MVQVEVVDLHRQLGGGSKYQVGVTFNGTPDPEEATKINRNAQASVAKFAEDKGVKYSNFQGAVFDFDNNDIIRNYSINVESSWDHISYAPNINDYRIQFEADTEKNRTFQSLRQEFNSARFNTIEEAYSYAEKMRKKINKLKTQ